jgi:hypothetical protein
MRWPTRMDMYCDAIVLGQCRKHTHKTKDRVTRTPLKIGGELRCSGRVINSCSTSSSHANRARSMSVVANENNDLFFLSIDIHEGTLHSKLFIISFLFLFSIVWNNVRKDMQYNGKMKKDKITNNDWQNTIQKTKDWTTRSTLRTEGWTQVIRKGKQFPLYYWYPSKLYFLSQILL